MSVDTGLSVQVFNVLKYFVISVFLEAVIRTSLDNVDIFFRALDLYHGRPVSLNRSRIDRYNLSSIIRFGRLPKLLFTLFLACCAYSVELLLEFSSTAEGSEFPISGQLDMYQPTHQACTPLQLDQNNTMDQVIFMASSCVVLTDQKYIFYNVTWQRHDSSPPIPICVHTRDNILHEGKRIYESLTYVNGSREEKSVSSFERTLRAHSWHSYGNSSRFTVLLSLTNADVQATSSYSQENGEYARAVLLSQVGSTSIQCAGTLFGRHGDGFVSARVYGCFGDISNGQNYIEASGTSLVEVDAEFVQSEQWDTQIVVRIWTAIYNFTSGAVDNDNLQGVQALTMLLSAGTGKDSDSVNKYAVVYKHCSDYFVPQVTDISRTQHFDKVTSEQRITVSISEWAIALLIFWPILLSLISLGLRVRGKWMKLPMNVHGEGDIGRRWLSRNGKSFPAENAPSKVEKKSFVNILRTQWFKWFDQQYDVFLNVEVGETNDDIIVGPTALNVERPSSNIFRRIN